METLRTSWLLDEFQQNLHSKADYSAALNHLLEVCPELGQYMADFQLVLTGDFPTWKYNKKLVAEVQLEKTLFVFNTSTIVHVQVDVKSTTTGNVIQVSNLLFHCTLTTHS